MRTLRQSWHFALFTIAEHIRSGRILLELLAVIGCVLIFFRAGGLPPSAEYFFSIASVLSLLLCFYTASNLLSQGDQPQGYMLFAHGIRRESYLLGLYLAIVGLVLLAYSLLSIAVTLLNPVTELDLRGWLAGTLPLALNVMLLAALMLLMTPFVLRAGWRLVLLAFIALAFSGNLISGPSLAALPAAVATALNVLRTVFGTPLLPAFTGFALAVSRDYSGISAIVPLTQLFLTLGLLALAIWVFDRRELTLGR